MCEIASLMASYDASNRLHIVVICDRGFKTELLFYAVCSYANKLLQIFVQKFYVYVTLFSLQNNSADLFVIQKKDTPFASCSKIFVNF